MGILDLNLGFETRGMLKNQGGYSTDMMTRGPGCAPEASFCHNFWCVRTDQTKTQFASDFLMPFAFRP